MLTACLQAVSITYTYCCVYSTRLLMTDRDSPKHVESYSKYEYEKLVFLVGFIKTISRCTVFRMSK